MRDIIFRGKRISDGEWVEGYLGVEVGGTPVIEYCGTDEDVGDYVEEQFVNPESIGEFTGLTDKNGNRIFEGDILHAAQGNFVVRWSESICSFVASEKERMRPCMNFGTMKCCEVIGNIFDNPELLESDTHKT